MRGLAMWIVLCAGCSDSAIDDLDDTGVLPTDATACEGLGPPGIELGEGGTSDFVPFADGQDLLIVQDTAGVYGFGADLQGEGLDFSVGLTTVLRITLGTDPSEDFIASLTYACRDDGVGTTGIFAALDDAVQDELAAQAIVGQPVELSVTATDQEGASASDIVDLIVAWPD